ncbi:MAG TPA: hypothetical protein VHN14_14955, partial [Kofleriaceae bacterium]|nr:hypothetical protein [Kofleriaceae bacterium]
MTRDKHLPLQLKLTAALVLIVITPLAASAYLSDQLGKTAANVAAGEASSRIATMEKAIDTYHDLVELTKRLHGEIAERLAQRPDFLALDPTANLVKVINEEPGLRAIALVGPDGHAAARAERPLPGPAWRDKVVDQPLGSAGATLRLTFAVSATVTDDLSRLKASIDAARTFSQIRTALPDSYRTAFLVLVGVAGLAAAGFGILASSFVTRRITQLVSTTRKISGGQRDARVELT